MDCDCNCYETRTFTPEGKLIRIARKAGRFAAGEAHPICAGCQNSEMEKMKRIALSLRPGESVTMRNGDVISKAAGAKPPEAAPKQRMKTDAEIFADFNRKFPV
jgi:hypothetical protein